MRFLTQSIEPEDIRRILRHIRASNWVVSSHAVSRMHEKGISHEELSHVVKHGHMIELHNEKGTWRVLLRDSRGTCIVLDLGNGAVITTYKNSPGDMHRTLDTSAYYRGARKVRITA